MEEFASVLNDAINSLSADVTVTLDLPQTAAQQAAPEITFDSVMVDGVGYVNLDNLHLLAPEMIPDGWHGLDVTSLTSTMPQMMNGQGGDAFSSGFAGGFQIGSTMDEDMAARFLNIERLDNATVDGTETAVFHTTFDLGAFYSDPEIQEILSQAMPEDTPGFQTSDLGTMFEGVVVDIREYIGLEDNYRHQIEVNMNLPGSAMGAGGGNLTFDMMLTYSSFNDVEAIEAPADATLHTLEELSSLFMGGMQPGMMPTATPSGN